MSRWLAGLLVLELAGALLAAPPVVTLPAETPGAVSNFVLVKPEVTGSKVVKYVPLDPGLNVFPSGLLNDQTVTVVTAAKPGKYRLLAYSGNQDGPSEPAVTLVVMSDVPTPLDPVKPPPVTPDDPKDPPVTGGKFYFLIVRADGPVDAATAKCVRLSAWEELKKDGHQYKDYPLAELPKGVKSPSSLPAVVTLRVSADGKSSSVVGDPKPLPTTDAGVKELLK